MFGKFPAILNFNWLFLKLNRFICNWLPVLQRVTDRSCLLFAINFVEEEEEVAFIDPPDKITDLQDKACFGTWQIEAPEIWTSSM